MTDVSNRLFREATLLPYSEKYPLVFGYPRYYLGNVYNKVSSWLLHNKYDSVNSGEKFHHFLNHLVDKSVVDPFSTFWSGVYFL